MPEQPPWTFSIAKNNGTVVRTAELEIASANETLPHMALALSLINHTPGPVISTLHGTDTNYQVHYGYHGNRPPANARLSRDEHGQIVSPCLIVLIHHVGVDPAALIRRTDQRVEDHVKTQAMDFSTTN